jgi:4-amino-4-deoxy-L-arabinose transferase-like glycosyltransferase
LTLAQGEDRRTWVGFTLAGAVVLLVALALRIMAARGDLWLDEIWSVNLLTLVSSPLDIFWRLTHDNNHHLNSLYLYFLGDDASVLARRGLAIAFGVASVAMAGLIGLRRGRAAALITMVLMALSYPMIHYSSEARGSGPMMFFVLFAFYCLEGFLNERRMTYSWLFALAIGLGFLSHMTIVFACLAFGLWGTATILRDAATARQAMADLVRCFAPVTLLGGAVLVAMFAGALDHGFIIGGGRIIAEGEHFAPFVAGTGLLLQLELGLPTAVDPRVSLSVFLVLGLGIIVTLLRQGDRRWSFYIIVLFAVPLVMLAFRVPHGGFPRYFLFSGVFLLVLLGQVLAMFGRAGGPGKALLATVLTLFAVGQSFLIGDFLKYGRGQHTEAFEYITNLSEGESITLGSNKDALNKIMINYYATTRPDGRTFDYVEDYETAEVSPEWLFMVRRECPGAKPMDFCKLLGPDRQNDAAAPELRRQVPESDKVVVYKLDREYFHWGLSGWDLSLYRKAQD